MKRCAEGLCGAIAIEQCAVQQRPVGAIAPQSPSAQRFIGLWRAIEKKLAERKAG